MLQLYYWPVWLKDNLTKEGKKKTLKWADETILTFHNSRGVSANMAASVTLESDV